MSVLASPAPPTKSPPIALFTLAPLTISIGPPFPLLEAPDAMTAEPDVPLDVVPVLKAREPDMPMVPAFVEATIKTPLDVAVDCPEIIEIVPPDTVEVSPAITDKTSADSTVP